MDCKTAARLLEPYIDGELDREDARALEAHVDECAACQAALSDLGRLRHAARTEATRYAAPQKLRERIRDAAAGAPRRWQSQRTPTWWHAAAACLACFIGGGALAWFGRASVVDSREQIARDLFASHWRALAATSPVDVVSSDRHTVRPWFAGKTAQAPLVRDFADQGFALVGGRVDYAGEQRVPVLVYRHDKHLIDVFVLPYDRVLGYTPVVQRDGYTLLAGTLDGQNAAIVSDLDNEELNRFRRLLDEAK